MSAFSPENWVNYQDPKYVTMAPPNFIEKSQPRHTLDEKHLAAFEQAIANILATELAQLTFTQLMDGCPLLDVVLKLTNYDLAREEPVYNHRELCPGAVEKAKAFRDNFVVATMEIRSNVLNRYQSAPVGSRASKMPLIELVAVTIHAIAVHIYEHIDGGFHKNDKYPDDEFYGDPRLPQCRRKPTPFSNSKWDNPAQCPDGNADIAAYWVEDQIFGGVVLFDRGESGVEHNGVWFHSSREGISRHVYALKDEQTTSLTRFLEAEPATAKDMCPLPILGDRESVRRDWDLSISKYNIYRDRWERQIIFGSYNDYRYFRSRNCSALQDSVEDPIEYPEFGRREFLWGNDS